MKIRTIVSLLTGRRYHWRVRLTYKNAHGVELAALTFSVCMFHPIAVDCHRDGKRQLAPALLRRMPRALLCNGTIDYEPVCYLGWW